MVMEISLQTMTSHADTLALARWAEDEGLAGLAVADHYLSSGDNTFALDQFAVVAAIAAQTRTLELSTLVSPVTFRHPAVMLKNAVTIDEISGGRFTLGVGAGWFEAEHERFGFDFPPISERFDRLEETLAYLRTALDGGAEGYEGAHYQLGPGPPLQPAPANLRVVVGGSGPRRTPDLAGRYADEFNVSLSSTASFERIERARKAAAGAGRDPEALLVSTAFPLVVGSDPADARARIAAVAERRGTTIEDIEQRWSQAGIPLGTPDTFTEAFERMEAEGITRCYFQVATDPLEDVRRSVGLIRR